MIHFFSAKVKYVQFDYSSQALANPQHTLPICSSAYWACFPYSLSGSRRILSCYGSHGLGTCLPASFLGIQTPTTQKESWNAFVSESGTKMWLYFTQKDMKNSNCIVSLIQLASAEGSGQVQLRFEVM